MNALPWMIGGAVGVGLDVGQRAVDVVRREVAVPQLLELHLHGAVAQLLLEDVPGLLFGIRSGVPQHEAGARDDLEVIGVSAVCAGARLDVDVELLRFGQPRERREDQVGVRRGEVPALRRDARPAR